MDTITDMPTRTASPPPAYTPPQRCYQTQPGSTQPSVYVPRGHPPPARAAMHFDHPAAAAAAAAADEKVLFYKPTRIIDNAGVEADLVPAYEDGSNEEWTPGHQRNASKLEARIRALEAQLRAKEGRGMKER